MKRKIERTIEIIIVDKDKEGNWNYFSHFWTVYFLFSLMLFLFDAMIALLCLGFGVPVIYIIIVFLFPIIIFWIIPKKRKYSKPRKNSGNCLICVHYLHDDFGLCMKCLKSESQYKLRKE